MKSVRELFLIPKYSKEKLSVEGFFDINILPHPEQNRIRRCIMAQICINSKGIKVVEIDKIKFRGKRKIDWRSVGENLKNYIGKKYMIDDMDDIIYIGTDFPDEYANSRDSVRAKGTIGKAKANVT